MPIYEYLCQKCGHDFEVMQKMSDKPLSRCPKCRGRLEKIISQTSFQLKGSGWYISDYARKSSQKEDKEPKEQKDKTESADAPASSDTNKEKSAASEKSGSDSKSEKTTKDTAKGTTKNAKSSPKSSD